MPHALIPGHLAERPGRCELSLRVAGAANQSSQSLNIRRELCWLRTAQLPAHFGPRFEAVRPGKGRPVRPPLDDGAFEGSGG